MKLLYSSARDTGALLLALVFVLGVALLLACVEVCDLVEALLKHWVGVAIVLVAWWALSGCSTAPKADPRDPEIFRPAAPVYPLPER